MVDLVFGIRCGSSLSLRRGAVVTQILVRVSATRVGRKDGYHPDIGILAVPTPVKVLSARAAALLYGGCDESYLV